MDEKYVYLLDRLANLEAFQDDSDLLDKYKYKIETLHLSLHKTHESKLYFKEALEESELARVNLSRRVEELEMNNKNLSDNLIFCKTDLQLQITQLKKSSDDEMVKRFEEIRDLYSQERDLNYERRRRDEELRGVIAEKNGEIRKLRDQLIRLRDLIKSKK